MGCNDIPNYNYYFKKFILKQLASNIFYNVGLKNRNIGYKLKTYFYRITYKPVFVGETSLIIKSVKECTSN